MLSDGQYVIEGIGARSLQYLFYSNEVITIGE